MQRIYIIFVMVSTLIFSGCSTLQIQSDEDPDFDFASLKTYAVLKQTKGKIDSLTYGHIVRAIEKSLDAKGYTRSDRQNADFLIMVHTNVKEKSQVVTDYQDFGIRPYGYGCGYGYGVYGGGMVMPVQRSYTYEEGKLMLDAIENADKKIFWRGIATDELHNLDTAKKRIKYIDNVVDQIFKAFPLKQG